MEATFCFACSKFFPSRTTRGRIFLCSRRGTCAHNKEETKVIKKLIFLTSTIKILLPSSLKDIFRTLPVQSDYFSCEISHVLPKFPSFARPIFSQIFSQLQFEQH